MVIKAFASLVFIDIFFSKKSETLTANNWISKLLINRQ